MTHARTLSRTAAIVVSAVLAAGSLLAGSGPAAASTPKTVTISGTVAPGARTSVSVTVVSVLGSKEWKRIGGVHKVNPVTGRFSFTVAKSATRVTLLFDAGREPFFDSYLGGISQEPGYEPEGATIFRLTGSHSYPAVELVPAGVIEGTITSTGGTPVKNSEVYAYASDGSDGGEWTYGDWTHADGSYYTKVPLDQTYFVHADKQDYDSVYYPAASDEEDATTVTLDASNGSHVAGIDILTPPQAPSIAGDFSSKNRHSSYETYLYELDESGTPTSSIPFASATADNGFYFSALTTGSSYALAFRDAVSGKWLAWTSHTKTRTSSAATAGANPCLLTFIGKPGALTELGKIRLSGHPCAAPFAPGAAFSGAVNDYDGTSKIIASLYYVSPSASSQPQSDFATDGLVLVDHQPVAADGSYSLPGITKAGQYVALFTPNAQAPFVPTWQDGHVVGSAGAVAAQIAAAPVVDAGEASAGNDVSLVGAAYVGGIVRGGAKRLKGAEVTVYEALGCSECVIDNYAIGRTDAMGKYRIKVAPGATYGISAAAPHFSWGQWKSATTGATTIDISASGDVAGSFNITLHRGS